MAVDPVNDHVFVSTPGSGSVEVIDFSGNIVDTITGLGVSPSTDANIVTYANDSIYMTETTNGAVVRIDPMTLSVTALTSGLVSPYDLVYSAGTLWTTTGGFWPPPTLVGFDIATGVTTSYPQLQLQGSGLASGPGLPNTVFSYDPGFSPFAISRIDVESTPTIQASQSEIGDSDTTEIDNVNDVAISPDGSELLPAGGYPYEFIGLDAANLQTVDAIYPADQGPTAIAVTSANDGLVAGGTSGAYGPDLIVYPLGNPSEQILSYEFPTTDGSSGNDQTLVRGLAFSPNGDLLFAVSGPLVADAEPEFHVFNLPNEIPPTSFSISVEDSQSATISSGGSATFSESGLPAAAAGTVSFSANGLELCTINLSGQADENTSCDMPSLLGVGNYTVTASFTDGDGSFQDSSSANSTTLVVTPAPTPTPTPAPPASPTTTVPPPSTPPVPATPTTSTSPPQPTPSVKGGGYDLVGSDGGVFVFNPLGASGGFYGSLPGMGIDVDDIVGMVPTTNDQGYYLVGSDGGVFAFGNAPFYGSVPGQDVHVHDIVGIIPTSGDTGYYLVGSDGGIFAFGSARYLGSLPAQNIHIDNVVGSAATPSGLGYWVVTSTGHVYNFGSASAYGSADAPVTAIAASPGGDGYWLVGPDGGIFTFGASGFYGSLPGQATDVHNIVGIVPSVDGKGYMLFGSDGGIFTFGDAGFEGSLPGINIHVHDIVGAVPTS